VRSHAVYVASHVHSSSCGLCCIILGHMDKLKAAMHNHTRICTEHILKHWLQAYRNESHEREKKRPKAILAGEGSRSGSLISYTGQDSSGTLGISSNLASLALGLI
jgi:hypothetical protein